MKNVIDAEDVSIIAKGAILFALLAVTVLVAALTAGTAWRLFAIVIAA